MSSKYFKYRKPFQFKSHPYDLGIITGLKRGHDDNHFLLKLYSHEATAYHDYYRYHLDYYLSRNAENSEKDFFAHVWNLVAKRITFFESRDPFSPKHALHVSNIEKLKSFQGFLSPKDQWNIRPNNMLLKEKEKLIADLREKIETLENRLSKLEEFEVSVKAMVQDDHLPTFIDLIHQLKDLQLSNGRKLLRADYDSPYYKLVAKYFTYEGKDIPINTARNYFVQKDVKDSKKGVKIPEDKKLFLIVPKKNK